MEKYYELSEDTIEQFNDVFNKKSFPVNVKFLFEGNSKQKKVIAISKIPEKFMLSLKKELLVEINEDLMMKFDDKACQILIEQEIDKLSITNDGKIKMVGTDLNTFSALVNKYGIEEVSRANQVELLTSQQIDDQESDEFIV